MSCSSSLPAPLTMYQKHDPEYRCAFWSPSLQKPARLKDEGPLAVLKIQAEVAHGGPACVLPKKNVAESRCWTRPAGDSKSDIYGAMVDLLRSGVSKRNSNSGMLAALRSGVSKKHPCQEMAPPPRRCLKNAFNAFHGVSRSSLAYLSGEPKRRICLFM